jgi:hypothetical protein
MNERNVENSCCLSRRTSTKLDGNRLKIYQKNSPLAFNSFRDVNPPNKLGGKLFEDLSYSFPHIHTEV